MEFWHYNKVVGIEISKKLGNTNTSDKLSEFLVGFINIENVVEDTKFLEPAVGTGSFYFAIISLLVEKGFDIEHIVENMVYGYDIDEKALSVLKGILKTKYNYVVNENTKIFNSNFLTADIQGVKFDYVITNPPYISNKNIEADPDFASKEEYITHLKSSIDPDIMTVSDIYIYFKVKCMQLLKENGLSIFLCSDSWIDSRFGDVLKKYILGNEYNLDLIVNSQLYPFFRDDTNAILTIISKSNKNSTQLVNLREELSNVDISKISSFIINKNDLTLLMNDDSILNNRNALILFYDYYFSVNNFYVKNNSVFCSIGDDFDVDSTSLTQASMLSGNMLIDYDATLCPVFWQKQARVNKLPNYKNKIEKEELVYSIVMENVPEKYKENIKSGNFYLSNVIDRYPLFFNVSAETFHVSKYFSLNAKKENVDNLEDIARLSSVYAVLDMELSLKEGTRKTLRKGECGLAKEIKKSDIEKIRVPKNIDFSKVKSDIDKYSEKVIYNIEIALLDENYIAIQKHITKELGLSNEDLVFTIKNLLFLYVLRMRNIYKIRNFESYFEDMLKKINLDK